MQPPPVLCFARRAGSDVALARKAVVGHQRLHAAQFGRQQICRSVSPACLADHEGAALRNAARSSKSDTLLAVHCPSRRNARQRATFILHRPSCTLALEFPVELLQLLPALPCGALPVDLRFGFPRAWVFAGSFRARLERPLLLQMQLPLPLGLVDLELLNGLALARVNRRILPAAQVLLHPELQLVLLLLALKLVLLQRARGRVVRRSRVPCHREDQDNRR